MGTLLQDLRYGARMLIRKPGFTLIAAVTLALGIGATTAIFSVVNAVLLRPLPYPEAERILRIGQMWGPENQLQAAGEPQFLFWRQHNRSFEAMASYQYIGSGFNLAGGNEAEFVNGFRVSADFFRVLRVSPALGRAFTQDEDRSGGPSVVILSDGLWRRRFGADESLIGRAVSLNGDSFTVVGILSRQFRFLPQPDVIVPMRPSLSGDPNPNQTVIGRLKPEVTPAQAQEEMKRLADNYRAAFPNRMQDNESAGVESYQEIFTSGIQRLLWILLGAVGFLLLIACANVANLQLTRASSRQREVAIRMALGAPLWRITRQLLVESILLALLGGTLGVLVAIWGTDAMLAAMPQGLIPRITEIRFDGPVLVFTLAAAILTGIAFGLAPALQATRVDVNDSLKEGSGKASGRAQGRLRGALVAGEIALSLVLLIGASLLIRTFATLSDVKPGFDPRNVLTFYISPNGERYDTAAETAAFSQHALERINSLPGVESAATTNVLPLVAQLNLPFGITGRPEQRVSAQFRMVSPDYFKVLRMTTRQGRAFTAMDTAGSPGVVIVNEAFVRSYLSDADPIGQTMTIGRRLGDNQRQIVGVVNDTKQSGLASAAPPTMFVPASQVPDKLLLMMRRFIAGYFIVRTAGEPLSLSAAVKREIADLDTTLPISSIRSLDAIVALSVARQRFNMLLVGFFAAIGLLLTAVGIYGVISYLVAQRTHEIGIRMALGARAPDVLKLVISQGMTVTAIGVAMGLIGAFALTRLMEGFLFGVSATDPTTFIAVALLLAAVALLACYIPARRATKVDPMIALRYE